MRVSHETIYRSLFIHARGVLKKELMEHLRSKRRCAARSTLMSLKTRAVKSWMPSPSAKGLQKWKSGQFLVIGKAICNALTGQVGYWNEVPTDHGLFRLPFVL
jgi:hypothetical protein